MYKILKQSTAAQLVPVYLVDLTDGYSPETGILSPTVYLTKNLGTPAVPNDGTWAELGANMPGWYSLRLNATDTATLGTLGINVVKTGTTRHFPDNYTVVPANVYDSLILGTDLLAVDVDQLDGSASSATKLEQAARVYKYCTVTTGTSSTVFTSGSVTEATADQFNGRLIVWLSGVLANGAALESKVTRITDYSYGAGVGTFTVEDMGETPTAADAFLIV